MALLKYFHPVRSELKLKEACGTSSVSSSDGQSRKQGTYAKFTAQDKAVIRKYTSEHGVTKAVRYFKGKDLEDSRVRDWKKAYKFQLLEKRKSTEPGEAVPVNRLDGKKQGRPPLLGYKLDLKLQERIVAMQERGTPIGSSTVIGIIGIGFLMRHKKPDKESDEPDKDWAVGDLQ